MLTPKSIRMSEALRSLKSVSESFDVSSSLGLKRKANFYCLLSFYTMNINSNSSSYAIKENSSYIA